MAIGIVLSRNILRGVWIGHWQLGTQSLMYAGYRAEKYPLVM